MARYKMSRGASRKVYRKGQDRIHKMNHALMGSVRGTIRL